MGYYTHYDITENKPEVIEAIEEISGYYGISDDQIKWYSCRDDMKRVSLMFPDKILHVYGEGEEAGDIWRAAYKNGVEQYQRAKIQFEDFGEFEHGTTEE